jgi:hypothetical protein
MYYIVIQVSDITEYRRAQESAATINSLNPEAGCSAEAFVTSNVTHVTIRAQIRRCIYTILYDLFGEKALSYTVYDGSKQETVTQKLSTAAFNLN